MHSNPQNKSFESSQRHMLGKHANTVEEMIHFEAELSDNPLKNAFKGKATVHPHIPGQSFMGDEAASVIKNQYRLERKETSLAYIHVPFCETRCLYCLFYQNPLRPESSAHYTDYLIKELQLWNDLPAQQSSPIHAVYFGGGTPTALEPNDLYRLIKAVRTYLPLANDCEITLEGRIHHFPEEKMEAAFKAGVNRVSLGVQTFNKDDVKTAISLPLDGVDCYLLNVFEKSPLGKFIANGKLPAGADKDERAEMFARSVELLTNAQWRRLSNNHWCQTFRERNIYNRFGKSAADCLAFGSGAGGKLNGYSFMIERKYEDWIKKLEAGIKPIAFASAPNDHWHVLRTVSSEMELGRINMPRLSDRFALPLDELSRDVFEQWTKAGLINPVGDWMVQTIAGQFWHVTMAQLLINVLGKRLAQRK